MARRAAVRDRLGALNEDLNSATDGDPSLNESYLVWGEDVLAVAPGTIVATRDELPDNTPPIEPAEPALEDLVGNRVVEDIGGGRFAVYAHLQQHGVAVHAAATACAAATFSARFGNSGGSTEPHLHFHLMDAAGGATAMAGNALPFVFDAFRLDGAIRDLETARSSRRPRRPRATGNCR